MVRIRRFGVIRTANQFAVVYLILTAIFVIPFALILAASPVTMTDQFGRTVSVSISPLFLLVVPFLYAGFGWLFTAVACLIYNLAARLTGGIEFEAIAVTPPPAPPTAPPPAPPPASAVYQPPSEPGAPQTPGPP